MVNKINIGVIITVYNKEKYIIRTLQSVLSQTVLPEELIIIDDCSQDCSTTQIAKLLPTLEEKISKVIFIKSIKNNGAAETRNLALKRASADFLMFLDADDQYINSYISDIKQVLAANTHVSMITSKVKMESSGLEYPSKKVDKTLVKKKGLNYIEFPFQTLSIESIFIGGGNVCFKRSYISDEILFDPLEKNFEEWDFYYRILKRILSNNESIIYLNKASYVYNDIDETSLSRNKISNVSDIVVPKIITRITDREENNYRKLLISIWFYNSITRLINIKYKFIFIKNNFYTIKHSALNRYFIGGILMTIIDSNVLNSFISLYKRYRFKK